MCVYRKAQEKQPILILFKPPSLPNEKKQANLKSWVMTVSASEVLLGVQAGRTDAVSVAPHGAEPAIPLTRSPRSYLRKRFAFMTALEKCNKGPATLQGTRGERTDGNSALRPLWRAELQQRGRSAAPKRDTSEQLSTLSCHTFAFISNGACLFSSVLLH